MSFSSTADELIGADAFRVCQSPDAHHQIVRNGDAAHSAAPSTNLKKEASEAISDRLGDVTKTNCGWLVLFSAGRLFLIRPVPGIATAELDSFVLSGDQLQ